MLRTSGRRARSACAASPRAPVRPAQRTPVRMIRLRQGPARVQVDLPVDVIVVLEQEERAGETQGTERALREHRFLRFIEHVFAKLEGCSDGRSYEHMYVSAQTTEIGIAEPFAT